MAINTVETEPRSISASPPLSIVILTLNEERNLAACLDSVSEYDDIHVLDSGSQDRTKEIAKNRGTPFCINPFQSFAQQRNWAIDHIQAKYPWQLHLDADERLTPAFTGEVRRVLASDPRVGGYLLPSKLMFANRWLKYAGQYPVYQVRLFHRDRLRFVDYGHGQRESTSFPLTKFSEPYLHYAFSKGLDHWFAKHALYARAEAEQVFRSRYESPTKIRQFFTDSTARRRALKQISFNLPGRYWLRLAYMILWQWAFLDGAAGMTYAQMMATYESMIAIHLKVLTNKFRFDASSDF